MAKKSGFEDIVDVASLMPWQVSLGIAVAAYFLFHTLSQLPLPANPTKDIGTLYLIGFSAALQYIIPLAFIAGGFFSKVKAKRRAEIFDSQSSLQTVRNLTWQEFELLIGEAYRRKGYSVVEHGGSAPDGGVDLVLTKDGRKTIVQCKHWSTYTVRVPMIREAYGVMVAEQADECVFVTSGRFTKEAQQFAEGKPIQMIDRLRLGSLLEELKPDFQAIPTRQVTPKPDVPDCPQCGSPMVRRKATRGRRAGQSFWGCTDYPNCIGTR